MPVAAPGSGPTPAAVPRRRSSACSRSVEGIPMRASPTRSTTRDDVSADPSRPRPPRDLAKVKGVSELLAARLVEAFSGETVETARASLPQRPRHHRRSPSWRGRSRTSSRRTAGDLVQPVPDGVTFRWKDYRAKGRTRQKTMTLSPMSSCDAFPACLTQWLPPYSPLRFARECRATPAPDLRM